MIKNWFMYNYFVSDEIIKAIAWTLLHSLWQGMILAIVAGAVILTTKKSSPVLRYNLLSAALVVFVLIVAATFVSQITHTISFEPKTATQFLDNQPQNIYIDWSIVEYNSSMIGQLIQIINKYAFSIAWCWFFVIAFKFLRMSFGIYGMYQLKTKNTVDAGTYWNHKLQDLCKQLQITQKVQLLQSGIIKVPAVVGYFKPVILFPAAMFTALPMHEIEAILIHELGHIRRRDFLVNFSQHMVEVIFFFNPAVLWISSLIKTERENCCDEITINNTGNKKGYIQALLNFENLQLKTPQLATAFAGQKNSLLNRVKRIIYNNNKTLNNMEKKFLSICLLFISMLLLVTISNKAQKNRRITKSDYPTIKSNQTPSTNVKDTIEPKDSHLPRNNTSNSISFTGRSGWWYQDSTGYTSTITGRMHTTIEGKKYIINWDKNKVTDLSIDGQIIAKEKIGQHQSIFDKLLRQLEIDMEQSRKDAEQGRKDAAQGRIDAVQGRKEAEQGRKDAEQGRIDAAQGRIDAEQGRRDAEQGRKDAEQGRKDAEQGRKDAEESNKLMNNIINDLISENIIKSKKEIYQLKLNSKELIVNDVKQSAAMHKKFKDKYETSATWSWGITTN
jgi:bla regulator protein blaR1